MDNNQDYSYFSLLSKSQKYKLKEKIVGEIIGDMYYPKNPYLLKKGLGKRKRFKQKTLEWFLMQRYSEMFSLVDWAKRKLEPRNLFREHLIWVYEAFQSLPRPQCCQPGCKQPATHFSIRTSADGQISFGLPYVTCSSHASELRIEEPTRISIEALLPNSVNIFQNEQDKKVFLNFLKDCFNFKNLSGQQIFKNLKKYLPSIKIKSPAQTSETEEKKFKNKFDPNQYVLGL